jgi:CHAT domain-containing protein
MKITIFEVCRSPEVQKVTEPVVLSRFFSEQGISYELYSNDGIWPERVRLDKAFIQQRLANPEIEIVHLAMHGDDYSFILRWSQGEPARARVPEDVLTGPDIRRMAEWQGKLVVSGACSTARLAHFFLGAGATAVVAPEQPVPWPNLGQFFCLFYQALFSGQPPDSALRQAVEQFPEYGCYQAFRRG